MRRSRRCRCARASAMSGAAMVSGGSGGTAAAFVAASVVSVGGEVGVGRAGWGRSPSNRQCAGQLVIMPFALLIGLGAGLASAVLFASASTGTILGLFVLFLL